MAAATLTTEQVAGREGEPSVSRVAVGGTRGAVTGAVPRIQDAWRQRPQRGSPAR
jgi:hypothetical protein